MVDMINYEYLITLAKDKLNWIFKNFEIAEYKHLMLKALSMRMVLNDWITNALIKFLERDGLLISVREQLVVVVKGAMTIRNKLDP